MFRDFLKSSLCSENLAFVVEVEDYRSTFTKVPEEKTGDPNKKAQSIYSKYINNSASKYEINLSGVIIQQIKQDIDNPKVEIFDKAQKEVFQLMEEDTYPRFRRYLPYRNFIDKVRKGTKKSLFDSFLSRKRSSSLGKHRHSTEASIPRERSDTLEQIEEMFKLRSKAELQMMFRKLSISTHRDKEDT
eukprot:TRINITY_DN6617_c0_g1_i2.p1 TRINITY_DN6617_c0_g1~~TRINITY_DN6617_c0_g1_i2.p1  ORF type:complete len:188 (-),score=60.54 TRINITY_DN6617_c0_g1_i2:323-886(-)